MKTRIKENNSRPQLPSKIAAIIPFFNECGTLRQVAELALLYTDHVIAVDDGSTDGSSDTLDDLFSVTILKNSKNMGKGFSLRRGIEWAVKEGFTSVVTIDADLQHDPAYIPVLLKELDKFDIVIGNRLGDMTNMPFQRKMSNLITSYLLSLKTGIKITDSQSGFRALKLPGIIAALPESSGFEAESEMIIKAAKRGLRIGFTAVPTIYGNEESKMRALQAIAGFIRVYFMKDH